MKIGILTFHCAHNYGAVLQAYALKEYLKSIGHRVEIIDYRPDYITNVYKPRLSLSISILHFKKFLKNLFIQIVTGRHLRKRYTNFCQFIASNLNPVSYNPKLEEFDYVFLGSDQIWSKSITGGNFDDNYFATRAECRIVSYAASTNITSLSDNDKAYLKDRLDRFYAISVREEPFANLINNEIGKDVRCVIDPTFLLDKENYDKISYTPSIDVDYVLVFELNEMPDLRRIGKDIAKQLNCKVIYLTGFPYLRRVNNSLTDISPSHMLGLFKKSKCIVTNSFHGTAFSLIYNKPFYVIRKGNSLDTRMNSLLSKIGLISRIINPTDRPFFSDIDYTIVTPLLKREVQKSKDFIEQSLKS